MILSERFPFGNALLFTKLESITGRRSDGDVSKLDTNIPNYDSLTNPLAVLEPQLYPEIVLGEYILIMRQQVVVFVISDTHN